MGPEPGSPERERAVLELLERALDLPEPERAGFLEGACPDPDLRARVAELLPLQSDLGPAPWAGWVVGDGPAAESAVESGQRIGSYEILCLLGAGGMGRVYEARQTSPRRRVALKVLRTELESEEAELRFRYESDVLARLRHPGIATVYEAGIHTEETAAGRRDVPWIALEYVEGAKPIDAYVRDEGLDLRARLELYLQVVDAVHHGHQRRVVHRDLKPANILVDATHRVRVIDFGVALATGEGGRRIHELTVRGELVGTVHYMSPEQAGGSREDPDVTSDVYSLGVVLYELVCGRHPHDLEGKSLASAVRVVAEEEPARPGKVVSGLPRDLEAILLTALEKDRDRRYASAAALGADLRSFLAGRPTAARPPGAFHHLLLYARRNPAVVGSLGLAVLVLLVATVLGVRFGLRERDLRREAEELQRGLLDQSFALHLDFAPRLAELEGSLDVRRSMIQEATDKLELLEARTGDDPEVRRRLALAYVSLGDVLGNPTRDNLGDLAAAERCYARSLAILGGLEDPSSGATMDVANVRLRLAQLALHAGRPDDALSHFEAFLDVADGAERADEGAAGFRSELAGVLVSMGSAHGVRGEFDRALELFERAHSIRRELLALEPGDPDRAVAAAVALSKVGTARWSRQDPRGLDDLRRAFAEVEAAAERTRLPRHRRTLAETAALVSDVLVQEGRLDAAREVLDRGLRVNEELRRGDPANAFYRRQWGQLTYNQGWCLRERGRVERARGDEGWRSTLEDGLEWLARSRDAWQEMAGRGELQPRELGHVERIDREIDELWQEISRE